MIKNIVFDIGNVLLQFKPKEYFAALFQDSNFSESVCDLMMSSDVWKKYDLGVLGLDDVKHEFQRLYPQYHERIEEMLDHWVQILEPLDYTMEKMLMLKRKGYGVYLLSNLNKEAYDYIKKRYHIFQDCDGYVVSFQEKLAKPDPEIYHCLCNRYQILPEESVFLDDCLENVQAAISCGFFGIHFNDECKVEEQLEALLHEQK